MRKMLIPVIALIVGAAAGVAADTIVFGTSYETNLRGETKTLSSGRIDVLDASQLHSVASSGLYGSYDLWADPATWKDANYFVRISGCGYKSYLGGAAPRIGVKMPFSATLTWDDYWPPAAMFDDPSAVQSPDGSVEFGAKAYSPDGTRYAREIDPQGEGNIGIFRVSDDQQILQFDSLTGGNDLKGLAWSRDSSHVAVMYHGGYDSGISLYNTGTGEHVGQLGPGSDNFYWFHSMVFSPDNAWIYTGGGYPVRSQFPTGLASKAPSFKAFSGVNLPWCNYGHDVGRNPWGVHDGFSSNVEQLDADLSFIAEHGARVVRAFIFCDLRSGVILDAENTPTGFDEYALEDFDVLVNAAEKHGLRLIPVLFDYMLADGVTIEGAGGLQIGEHPELITDPDKRDALVSLIGDLIWRYRYSSTILAWDIMNEPEYASAVTADQLKEFVRALSWYRGYGSQRTTLGCAHRADIANYADLDFSICQFHYYDDMESASPLDQPVGSLGGYHPIIIGEAESTSAGDKISTACNNGYLGILFWSLNAPYGGRSFRDIADEYKAWTDDH